MNIIDRRPNPKGKSLANRQRFTSRTSGAIREAVADVIAKRKIGEEGQSGSISIPIRGITEPVFRHAPQGGKRERIFPGFL